MAPAKPALEAWMRRRVGKAGARNVDAGARDISMSDVRRRGLFWDMIEGRAPAPPAAVLLGWKLERVDPETGTIRVQFEARDEFMNPVGTVQGGMLTAMLDDTMGPAAVAHLGGEVFCQTLELKTSFLRPARPGKLYGEGRVVHRGRDVVFLEGRLEDADGRLIATATATSRIIPFASSGDS
jgi:uncharacterized protein (TIGR00369 family)